MKLFNPDKHINVLSVSRVLKYMKCQKAHYWSYEEKLKPIIEQTFLTTGKLCHIGMQYAWLAHYRNFSIAECINQGIQAMQEYFDDYMTTIPIIEDTEIDLEEIFENAKTVFKNAFLDFKPHEWQVCTIDGKPATELHFMLDFPGFDGFHGFIDLIAEHKETKQIFAIDYKFVKSLGDSDEKNEAYNLQNAVYVYACKELGIDVSGTITYKYLSGAPTKPSINKNGTISRAKIKTNWQTYARFCIEHRQNPKDYESEMKPKLDDIEWFKMIKEYRNDETLERIWNGVIIPAGQQINTCSFPLMSMFPWNCSTCEFSDLCQAEIRNYDMEYMKQHVYTKKESYNHVTESEN